MPEPGGKRIFDDVSWPTRGQKLGAQHLHERGSDYAACGVWIPKPGTPSGARPGEEWDGALCLRCAAVFLKLEREGEPVERALRPLSQMVRSEVAHRASERSRKAQATRRERLYALGLVRIRALPRSRPSELAERLA